MCLAIPGRVMAVGEDSLRTSTVAFGSVERDVSLALLPEANVGDYVIVHAGLALQVIDEEAAASIFETLRQLDEALSREQRDVADSRNT